MKKLRVVVLFGGRSGKHEVWLFSVASFLKAIKPEKYEVLPIGITKNGRWVSSAHAEKILAGEKQVESTQHLRAGDPQETEAAAVLSKGETVIVPPVPQSESLVPLESASGGSDHGIHVAVVFPVLHSTFREDCTLQ